MELRIKNGYTMVRRRTFVEYEDIEDFARELKKSKKYTSVQKKGTGLLFVTDYIQCPRCRRLVPAYKKGEKELMTITERMLDACYNGSREEQITELRAVYNPTGPWKCPKCGKVSEENREEEDYIFTVEKGADCQYLLLACRRKKGKIKESLVYDFVGGNSIYSSKSTGPIDVCCRAFPERSWLHLFFSRDLYLRRIVTREFSEAYWECFGEIFPFDEIENSLELMARATRFVFPPPFLNALPYNMDGSLEHFPVLRKLRNVKQAEAMYKSLKMPEDKEIRFIFMIDPWLYIYLEELSLIWNVTKDLEEFKDKLVDLSMNSENVAELHAQLHCKKNTWSTPIVGSRVLNNYRTGGYRFSCIDNTYQLNYIEKYLNIPRPKAVCYAKSYYCVYDEWADRPVALISAWGRDDMTIYKSNNDGELAGAIEKWRLEST